MTIDMTRHNGATGISVAECIDQRFGVWRVRTDFQPDINPETEEQRGVTFIETEFPYKPTIAALIIAGFDYKVKHGKQKGTKVKVWLSKENQEDFHAMHQNSDGLTFPVRYKVGEIDGTPVYEEFADVDEMHAVCVSTTNHVLSCQQAGWAEKDAIDWTPYEEALDPEVE